MFIVKSFNKKYFVNNKRLIKSLLFLLAASLPFFNIWRFGSSTLISSNQLTILILVSFIASYRYNSTNSQNRNIGLIPAFYMLYFVGTLISMALTYHNESAVYQTLWNFQFFIMFLCLVSLNSNEESVHFIYKGLFVGFIFSLFIAVFQYFGFSTFAIFAEEDLNQNTLFVVAEEAIDTKRIWGPFGNALTFSLYLSVSGIVLFYYSLYCLKRKVLAWIVFMLTLFSIMLTISRMAIFAFLIAFIVTQFLIATTIKRVVYIGLLLLGFFAFSVVARNTKSSNPLFNRLTNSADDLKEGRLGLWKVGFKAFQKEPFWGTGPGNLNYEISKFPGWTRTGETKTNTGAEHVENYYLTLLCTYGIFPFLFYLAFVFCYFNSSLKLLISGYNTGKYMEAMPLFPGFVSFFVNNLINPALFSDLRIQFLFLLLISVTSSYEKKLTDIKKY